VSALSKGGERKKWGKDSSLYEKGIIVNLKKGEKCTASNSLSAKGFLGRF